MWVPGLTTSAGIRRHHGVMNLLRVRSPRLAALAAGAAVVVAAAASLTALSVAYGERLVSGSSYSTEYINMPTYALTLLAVPLVGFAAYHRWWAGVAGAVGAAGVAFAAMVETVHRYDESGWADGLEVLGFIAPVGLTLFLALAVVAGSLIGLRRDRADLPSVMSSNS